MSGKLSGPQANHATPKPAISLARPGILQRTCECGGVPGLTGECEECSSQRLSGQRGSNPPALPNNPPDDQSTGQIQRSPLAGYSFGNLAIKPQERLGIQTKLAIGQPGDKYEQEADRVADQVMRMPASKIQRLRPECQEKLQRQPMEEKKQEEETVQTKPLEETITLLIQRRTAATEEEKKEEETLQPKTAFGEAPTVSPALQNQITALQGGGQPLPQSECYFFESRFGTDFSQVRIHANRQAADAARAVNARAFTLGQDVVFGTGQYQPKTSEGQRLLAHELTHVVQQSGNRQNWIQRDEDSVPADPFAKWQQDKDLLLLIVGDDKLLFVPAGKAAFTPSDKALEAFKSSSAHYTQDLGTLFEVPASGASGTRVFRAGNRSAVLVDTGYDPTPGQSPRAAAVYIDEVMAIASRNGISKVSKMLPIHGHSDHVAGMTALASEMNIKAENVIVPKAFANLPPVRRVVSALSTTTDAGLIAKGFGRGWSPNSMPKDKAGAGDLYQGRMMVGELVFDFVALRSALKNATAQPDLGSYLTRVTRRTDNARVVLLGDLRGANIERIRNEMETNRSGAWNEFFAGVTTLSGFSHHLGRMGAEDVTGIMMLLDATLLREGKLRVIEQTNLGVATQARRDTIELASRLGIEVAYTDMPAGAAAGSTSAAGATRDTVYTRGPAATATTSIASALTQGQQRLQSLGQCRLTIEQWRPWLEELNGKEKIDALVTQIDQSMQQLRQGMRDAAEAAVNVRAEARPAGSTGARDYTAGSSGAGANYAAALTRIPAETAAERTLDAKALENLKTLRERDVESQPLSVAVHRAITRGEYSNQAFSYMMSQLNPSTRDELIGRKAGVFGSRLPRHIAFERVRTQYHFERSVLPGETISLQHFSPIGRAGARGVGGVLLVAELWSSVGQPLYESHKISRQINVTKNLAPFLRRIGFWQEMGLNPSFEGVSDPVIGSPDYYNDPKIVIDKLKDDDLDAIYITKPGLSDADVLQLAVWLSMNVRNYDEYATLFEDSFQDAVRWRTTGTWNDASWDIRVGRYETSGSNHVEEEWYEHPKLTEMMRHYIPWLIANTGILLGQAASDGKGGSDFEPMLGHMAGVPSQGGKALTTLRLRNPKEVPIVSLPLTGQGDSWNPGPVKPELAELKVPGEALFFELERHGSGSNEKVRVSGANFNTYAAIRDLEMRHWSHIATSRSLNELVWRQGRNEFAWVWIDAVLLKPVEQVQQGAGDQAQPKTAPPATTTPTQAPKVNIQSGTLGGFLGPADSKGASLPGPVGPRVFGPPLNQTEANGQSNWIGPGIEIPLPFRRRE